VTTTPSPCHLGMTNTISPISPVPVPRKVGIIMKSEILAKVNPENIDMLTKLIEAYDNLGIVSTIDREQGLVIIRGTEDTYPELQQILKHLPFPIEIQ
jgi:hypothetical protein